MLKFDQPNSKKIVLGGEEVEVKGLTVAQFRVAAKVTGDDDVEREALLIMYSTGAPIEDCRAFVAGASFAEYSLMMDTIAEVSNLGEAARFQNG